MKKRALIATASAAAVLSVGTISFNLSAATAAVTPAAAKAVVSAQPTAAAPAAVEVSPGNLAIFARAANGTVQVAYAAPGATWTKWANVPTAAKTADAFKATSALTAVSPVAGQIELLTRGVDDNIWVKSYKAGSTASGWSAWRKLEGNELPDGGYHATSAPSAIATGADTIELFFRGLKSKNVRQGTLTRTATGWSVHWSNVKGLVASGPSVVSPKTGELALFAIGAKNDVMWNVWKPTAATTDESALDTDTDLVSVPVRDVDAVLELQLEAKNAAAAPKGAWSGWKSLGGVATSPPTAVATSNGMIDAFVRGRNPVTYVLHYDGKTWEKSWTKVGGESLSAPSALYTKAGGGYTSVFLVGVKGNVYVKYHVAQGWTNWNRAGEASFKAGKYLG